MERSFVSGKALALSVATAVVADRMTAISGEELSARAYLLGGLPLAVGMMILTAFVMNSGVFCGDSLLSRFGQAGLLLWSAAELVFAVRDAQTIGWQQFSSMAVIGILPALLWAGWSLPSDVLSRSAKILWVLVAAGGVIFVVGLLGQFQWENLLETTMVNLNRISKIKIPFYAEYFVLAFFSTEETTREMTRKIGVLPLGAFLLEGGCRIGMELLFGAAERYPGYELLRAWTLGMFSRFDSFFLLVWLAAGLFRICLLTRILRSLTERFSAEALPGGEVQS